MLYRLMPLEGSPECVVHFNRLKPCMSSLAVTNNPVSWRADPPDGRSSRRQRSEAQFGTGWVHHRHPTDLETSGEGRLAPRAHVAQTPTSSGVGGMERIPPTNCSGSPVLLSPPEGASAPCSIQEERPVLSSPADASECPSRHWRPPVWSHDYQMSS